jgi:hypothetical protein
MDLYHFDADPDPTYHVDADPDPDFLLDTAPDPHHWELASHPSEEHPNLFNNQPLSCTFFRSFSFMLSPLSISEHKC